LTPGSKGNALGLGLADFVSQRLLDKTNWQSVRTNVLHTGFLNRAKVPLSFANDRELLQGAFTALGSPPRARARIVRIADTNHLGRLWVSEALLDQVKRNSRLRAVGVTAPLDFDRRGNLKPLAREII